MAVLPKFRKWLKASLAGNYELVALLAVVPNLFDGRMDS